MKKISIKQITICFFAAGLMGCATSNTNFSTRDKGFYQHVVPSKYAPPLPVEIAKDIESITEDGVLQMKADPLTTKGISAISEKLDELEMKVSLEQRIQILEQRTIGSVSRQYPVKSGAGHYHVHKKAPAKYVRKKAFLAQGGGPLMRKHRTRRLGGLSKGSSEGPVSGKNRRATASTGGQVVIYTVKWGDTLMKIAFDKYANYLKWKDIYRINKDKMKSPRKMQVGTELTIENVKYVYIKKEGQPYLIRKEDTLKSISKKLYGTEDRWKDIWKNNPQLVRNPKKIYAGFTLYAPNSKELKILRVPANKDKDQKTSK